jgi:hypothetical protein
MILFRKKEENVSGYNRVTRGWDYIEIFGSIKKIEEWIESHHNDNYFVQDDGSVLDCSGNTVRESGDDLWNFFDFEYHVVNTAENLSPEQRKAMELALGVMDNTGRYMVSAPIRRS